MIAASCRLFTVFVDTSQLGRTPFMYAGLFGQITAMQELMADSVVDLNAQDKVRNNRNPLTYSRI